MKLEKKLKDSHGEIIVRVMTNLESRQKNDGEYIAEIIAQGCVIGFYVLRSVDDTQWIAELHEVHDRLTAIELDEGSLKDALYWGREIADAVIAFNWEES